MEHMQAAYEALISKLKTDLEAAHEEVDKRVSEHLDIEEIFMSFVYEHHGKDVLMELGKKVDETLGRKDDYTDYIDCYYD